MASSPPFVKWISDPLYGSIPLTEVEVDVIDTRAFQRLRHIGQLGLVCLVFPSATYSRFTHSIGACHVLGEVLERLGMDWSEHRGEWQLYRLAMLLHDVGHFFMSHATEHAAKTFYTEQKTMIRDEEVTVDSTLPDFVDHEHVGKVVVENDDEIRIILSRYGIEPSAITNIFTLADQTVFSSLVSSDLDADRLDYLLRSSQATGLPYGFHDRDFILRNIELVDNPNVRKDGQAEAGDGEPLQYVCIKEKAVQAADHLLHSRMFDRLQVTYQSAVVGLELMLEVCVRALLRLKIIALDAEAVTAMVKSGEWYTKHDGWLWATLETMRCDPLLSTQEQFCVNRLLERRPPSVLYSYECIFRGGAAQARGLHVSGFNNGVRGCPELEDCTVTWLNSMQLMTAKTHILADEVADKADLKKVIRISQAGRSVSIIRLQQSVAAALGDSTYEMARVYFTGPTGRFEAAKSTMKRIAENFHLPGRLTEKESA